LFARDCIDVVGFSKARPEISVRRIVDSHGPFSGAVGLNPHGAGSKPARALICPGILHSGGKWYACSGLWVDKLFIADTLATDRWTEIPDTGGTVAGVQVGGIERHRGCEQKTEGENYCADEDARAGADASHGVAGTPVAGVVVFSRWERSCYPEEREL